MAAVPREAVEFSRMLVRAFYPPEYVVVLDGVLRSNNYCAHHDLARRLKIPPKELRTTMVRMVHARIMRSEKRQQKRINFRDSSRPSRTVNTEFWYVPLVELIDAFLYRVDVISRDIDEKLGNELEQQMYRCSLCQSRYKLLDLLNEKMTEDNEFQCAKMGVRPDRRTLPCGGIVREEDNRAVLKEAQLMKQRFVEDLRPLRSRAAECSRMDIPAHPLDGADEETWGSIVPETIGVHGEIVDEEGLTEKMAAQMKDESTSGAGDVVPGIDQKIPAEAPADDAFIPAKPSWFSDAKKGVDEEEDDWVDDGTNTTNILTAASGTAASFAADADDAKSYYDRYLQEAGGADAAAEPSPQPSPDENAPAADSASDAKVADVAPSEPADDPFVQVAGEMVKLSEITDEMTEKMSGDEYKAYFALSKGQEGDSDDDDEYE